VPHARKIAYQYSNSLWSDDLEIDLTGELTFKQGDLISRRGKNWKINSVLSEDVIDYKDGMPTIWVLLVNAPVN